MVVLSRRVGEGIVIDDRYYIAPSTIDKEKLVLRVAIRQGSDTSEKYHEMQVNDTVVLEQDPQYLAVTLIDLRFGHVRIGVVSPNDRPFYREEIWRIVAMHNADNSQPSVWWA